jgi:hypothetical protein
LIIKIISAKMPFRTEKGGKISDMAERPLSPEEEEKDGKRRKNPRERTVMDAYEKAGWTITTRGFPCFLARKDGQPVRLVWVERKNINPAKAGLSESQRRTHSIFTVIGVDTRIVDPDQEPLCDPDSTRKPPPG